MKIITREEWGARYPAGFADAALPAQRLYLHHSVTIAPDLVPPFDDDDAAIRTLEAIGQGRFGGGISYTFAVTPVGRIYEGHGVGRRGAHTAGLNTVARAICWVGDYDKHEPTPQMVDATVCLVRHGFEQGWWREPRLTGGHRDAPGAATECPGDRAYRLIGDINLRAAAAASTPTTPTLIESGEDDEMHIPIRVTADGRFAESFCAEAGGGGWFGRGLITVGSAWGSTRVWVTGLSATGDVAPLCPRDGMLIANNQSTVFELPEGTRHVTVEGRVENAPQSNGDLGTRPWAAWLAQRV